MKFSLEFDIDLLNKVNLVVFIEEESDVEKIKEYLKYKNCKYCYDNLFYRRKNIYASSKIYFEKPFNEILNKRCKIDDTYNFLGIKAVYLVTTDKNLIKYENI